MGSWNRLDPVSMWRAYCRLPDADELSQVSGQLQSKYHASMILPTDGFVRPVLVVEHCQRHVFNDNHTLHRTWRKCADQSLKEEGCRMHNCNPSFWLLFANLYTWPGIRIVWHQCHYTYSVVGRLGYAPTFGKQLLPRPGLPRGPLSVSLTTHHNAVLTASVFRQEAERGPQVVVASREFYQYHRLPNWALAHIAYAVPRDLGRLSE